MARFRHWKIRHHNSLCTLSIDVAGKKQNVLSFEVISELALVLDEIEKAPPAGLVIRSGKPDSFISGADMGEFEKITHREQALEIVGLAHQAMNRIESMPMPTVALIHGHCLGGGLELALACDYRVCCDAPSIRLGLPEVRVGIHPGFGGSVRLIETVGVTTGMDLMLSGRTLVPFAAKKAGIIDLCVPSRQLDRAAGHLIDQKLPRTRASRMNAVFSVQPVRSLMARILRKKVASRARQDHYPAPYALIDLWEKSGGNREAMLAAEQVSVTDLVMTTPSRNLVRVFFLQEALKKTGRPAIQKEFRRVHIVGAGLMGTDIASWCALQGLTVTLHDRNPAALATAYQRAHGFFQRRLKQSRRVERAMDRFQVDVAGTGARYADVIIEAAFEDAKVKIGVFAEMEKIARPDAVLATNTSSIPLEIIGNALKRPGRLVGLHFFNPVAKMQLVEIVKGEKTYAKSAARATAFAGKINRLPVQVRSSPGFLVNRVLMPYALEAMELLGEGAAPALIDRAATGFGMPMGPITLADTVGLDICHHVGETLTAGFGGSLPAILKSKVDAGELGRKTGKGFYTWKKGKPVKEKTDSGQGSGDMEDRLIFRYLNECMECLHQGIVESPSQLDAALIFGTGFAPFTGGPIHYIHEKGVDAMLDRLKGLHSQYGVRFKPSKGWFGHLD